MVERKRRGELSCDDDGAGNKEKDERCLD